MSGRKRKRVELADSIDGDDSPSEEVAPEASTKLDRNKADYQKRLMAWQAGTLGAAGSSTAAQAAAGDAEDEPIVHVLVRARQSQGRRVGKPKAKPDTGVSSGADEGAAQTSYSPAAGLFDDVKPARRQAVGLPLNESGLVDHDWREEKWLPAGVLVRGRWTAREDDRLRSLLVEYAREVHGLSREELVEVVTAGAQEHDLRGFWIDFAARFRWRSVKSIFLRAYRLFLPGNYVGRWSVEDLETLQHQVAVRGKHWATIGRAMGRHPTSCQVIWTARFSIPGRCTDAWAAPELKRLAGAVLRLREGAFVPWQLVSKAVGTRTAGQCSSKWNGSFGARADGVPWGPRRELRLVRAVLADGAESLEDVDWAEVAGDVGGLQGPQARSRFRTLCKRVPGHRVRALPEVCRAVRALVEAGAARREQAGAARREQAAAVAAESRRMGTVDVEEDLPEFTGLYDKLLGELAGEEAGDQDALDALAEPEGAKAAGGAETDGTSCSPAAGGSAAAAKASKQASTSSSSSLSVTPSKERKRGKHDKKGKKDKKGKQYKKGRKHKKEEAATPTHTEGSGSKAAKPSKSARAPVGKRRRIE